METPPCAKLSWRLPANRVSRVSGENGASGAVVGGDGLEPPTLSV